MNDSHDWIPMGRAPAGDGDLHICRDCGAETCTLDDGREAPSLMASLACVSAGAADLDGGFDP